MQYTLSAIGLYRHQVIGYHYTDRFSIFLPWYSWGWLETGPNWT